MSTENVESKKQSQVETDEAIIEELKLEPHSNTGGCCGPGDCGPVN